MLSSQNRPCLSVVLTGSAVSLDNATTKNQVGSVANDVNLIKLCVSHNWFLPRRVVLLSNLTNKDRQRVVEEFVRSFDDCTVPASATASVDSQRRTAAQHSAHQSGSSSTQTSLAALSGDFLSLF